MVNPERSRGDLFFSFSLHATSPINIWWFSCLFVSLQAESNKNHKADMKHLIKSLLLIATLLALPLTFTSCEDILGEWSKPTPAVVTPTDTPEPASPVKLTSITLNKPTTTILVGKTETLTVETVTPDDAADKTVTWSSDKTAVATVDDNGLVTAVAVGTAIITATAKDGSGVTDKCTVTVSVPGLLAGEFSVAADKKVRFAQGNLQYKASPSTWRFAEHQYDYVGDNTNGNVYESETKCNNASISDSYTGWIDLFGWGTSGYNHGATCYQPYCANSDNDKYYAYGDASKNLYDNTGKADWGYNSISNGGNEEKFGWRTLTSAEWQYIIKTRTGAKVYNTSNVRCTMATINIDATGVNGLILFPDGLTFAADEATWGTFNDKSDYTTLCTSAQWTALAEKGCVFLPAAGFRGDTMIHDSSADGYYWSSTYYSSSWANDLVFCSSYLYSGNAQNRYHGFSVRLVYEVK